MDYYDTPGRPHMRNRPNVGRRFGSCFRWHFSAVACLVNLFGTPALLQSALTSVRRSSAHCAGIGTDKLVVEQFLKPALARYGVHCPLESLFSVETLIVLVDSVSICSDFVFEGMSPNVFFQSIYFPQGLGPFLQASVDCRWSLCGRACRKGCSRSHSAWGEHFRSHQYMVGRTKGSVFSESSCAGYNSMHSAF